ncbi:ABC transporter ATP-binding protein [Saccharothrix syringae]|uniref:ABC transporter ATP-binding protein n=1 Tax=Saccharothrix syringae TaxID=103733 RepID=A0A5Q0H5T4_SACSY|nr:ABC transporter ATP-binding protein [Saccharothrix syringae]QFZ21566.1 ABC transporter ATP-binding protein [Saccharothrix syringae]
MFGGRRRDQHGRGGNNAPAAVRLDSVRKTYGKGDSAVEALRGVDIALDYGSFTAVMGPSGSGKSTFLQCAAGLDQPSSGAVILDGVDLTGMSEVQLTELRRERVGFIFQSFNLLPALTVEQNVTLPMKLAGRRIDRNRVADVIGRVGLEQRRTHLPGELSGGQQQRVAIARALVSEPAVVFADEPTGALDTRTALEVLDLMRESVLVSGQTIVMVTHDPVAASHADSVIFLIDGQIIGQLQHPTAEAVAERMTHLTAMVERPQRSFSLSQGQGGGPGRRGRGSDY